MAEHVSTEGRVRAYLADRGGSVEDPAGRSLTEDMARAIGVDRAVTLSTVLRKMEDEGVITRDIRGLRTYRISLAGAGPAAPVGATEGAEHVPSAGAAEGSAGTVGVLVGEAPPAEVAPPIQPPTVATPTVATPTVATPTVATPPPPPPPPGPSTPESVTLREALARRRARQQPGPDGAAAASAPPAPGDLAGVAPAPEVVPGGEVGAPAADDPKATAPRRPLRAPGRDPAPTMPPRPRRPYGAPLREDIATDASATPDAPPTVPVEMGGGTVAGAGAGADAAGAVAGAGVAGAAAAGAVAGAAVEAEAKAPAAPPPLSSAPWRARRAGAPTQPVGVTPPPAPPAPPAPYGAAPAPYGAAPEAPAPSAPGSSAPAPAAPSPYEPYPPSSPTIEYPPLAGGGYSAPPPTTTYTPPAPPPVADKPSATSRLARGLAGKARLTPEIQTIPTRNLTIGVMAAIAGLAIIAIVALIVANVSGSSSPVKKAPTPALDSCNVVTQQMASTLFGDDAGQPSNGLTACQYEDASMKHYLVVQDFHSQVNQVIATTKTPDAIDIPNLGDSAYYVVKDLGGGQSAGELWVVKGNSIMEITYIDPSNPQAKPPTQPDSGVLELARQALNNL